jgi:hypothetical protein
LAKPGFFKKGRRMRNETAARNGRRGTSGRVGLGVLALLAGAAFALPQAADAATNTISTVAGGGRLTTVCNADWTDCHLDFGDGGPATSASLVLPSGVATTPDGGYVVSQWNWDKVRRVSPNGTITTIAGTNLNGFSGDGGPATSAKLNMPLGVAVQADGGFLIADYEYNRVRHVSPTGTITTVAGSGGLGQGGFAGDGGPATGARLDSVMDAVQTPDGGLLIVDTGNNRIRRVSPTGTITTVAGNVGFPGAFSGDGGLATLAGLTGPSSVAVTAGGDILIADSNNNRVRLVDADLH